jgi:acetyl-CoA carboxylase beta subunit
MKICNKCGIEKDEREFRKNKYGKDGLRTNCKDCEKLSYKEYYKRNKEKLNKKNKT